MTTVAQALMAGFAHHQAGRRRRAGAIYREVLRHFPSQQDALRMNAALVGDMGRPGRAIDLFRLALAVNPQEVELRLFLSAAYENAGLPDAAMAELGALLRLRPGHAGAHNNLAILLHRLGKPAMALAHWRRALVLAPAHVQAAANAGGVLVTLGRPTAALRLLHLALALDPASPDSMSNCGLAWLAAGEPLRARGWFARALRLDPGRPSLHSNHLFALHYDPGLSEEALFQAHRHWAETQAVVAPLPPPPRRPADGRLTIAYLSADFYDHPVARNIAGLIEHHDRARFRVILFADLVRPDAMTERLAGLAEGLRVVPGWPDAAIAEAIRQAGVDILVVLAGHTARNRPRVAAYRPAPLQLSMHDLTTSGLTQMDGWITDAALHPPGTPERFTERLVRLPCFYLYTPPPPVEIAPLPHPGPVFGSFNNPAKLTDPVLDLWAELLRAVPDARLLLKYKNLFADPLARGRIERRLGTLAGRVDFLGQDIARADHLALLNRIDVALDPFPFSGHTTAFEALWMGVPLVTLAGRRFTGRVGVSLLAAIGQGGWVAETPAQYLEIAARLARAPADAAARRALRARVAASPLLDAAGYAHAFEAMLLAMWAAR